MHLLPRSLCRQHLVGEGGGDCRKSSVYICFKLNCAKKSPGSCCLLSTKVYIFAKFRVLMFLTHLSMLLPLYTSIRSPASRLSVHPATELLKGVDISIYIFCLKKNIQGFVSSFTCHALLIDIESSSLLGLIKRLIFNMTNEKNILA
jgi:hypothetical protein